MRRHDTDQGATPIVVRRWPFQMDAATAADFCGERSVDAFRRSVGKLYPQPKRIAGKGQRWLREDLERAVRRMHGQDEVHDAADVL